MAIAISSQNHSKFYSFGADNSGDCTSSEVPMVGVMAYHYPPLSPTDNEMGMPPQGFMPSYTLPSQQLSSMSMVDPHAPLLGQEHGLDPKVSYSAPNSASLHPSDVEEQQQNGSSGEKKRNKLGYHRTSVACGHCRRRKIRCITSPNDTQGRCINCIRLKKDCSFFPVDQASVDDSRGRQTSKSTTAPKGKSATSSPATPISNLVEQPKKAKLPFVPSSKRPGPITVPKVTEVEGAKGLPPQTKASGSSPENMTPSEAGTQYPTNWIVTAPEQSPTSSSNLSTPWHTYTTGSPMSTQFSPFTSVNHSPSGWPPGNSEPVPQGEMDMPWCQFAPPTRSMSYGGEPLGSNHPSQYPLMAPGRQFERRPSALSDAYTTSMGGMVPGFDGSNINTAVPFPPNAVPAASYATWDQTQTYPGYTYVKNHEAYGDDWSRANREQDQQMQENPSQQVINNATMNVYQTQ
ncbi:hypothetical protein FBEOM_9063 [Fusarium beomiforme]|uniref:Zn(2)-C6 fungal-type domain-containing protein n=1 Tax=Fusarium beomiforme TaxID=44412 RepID=A0A9P5AE50_9HYPO|nr:hypothetical protein FBEOM_9063 [Fusarium beomiforme]